MRTALAFMIACLTFPSLASCGYSGNGGGVGQGEVTLVVENQLDQPRYINWIPDGAGLISCEFEEGGRWTGCLFDPPYCKKSCSDENHSQPCCMRCVTALEAKEINPGESMSITWAGKLYTEDDAHCSECSCYREKDPSPGAYRASVQVFDSYTCESVTCPNNDGIIVGAQASGNPSHHSTEFKVEHEEDTLTIPIN